MYQHLCTACTLHVFKTPIYYTVRNLPQACHFCHIWKTFWETPGLKDKVNCNSLWGTETPEGGDFMPLTG